MYEAREGERRKELQWTIEVRLSWRTIRMCIMFMAMVLCGGNHPLHKTLRQKTTLISIAKDTIRTTTTTTGQHCLR